MKEELSIPGHPSLRDWGLRGKGAIQPETKVSSKGHDLGSLVSPGKGFLLKSPRSHGGVSLGETRKIGILEKNYLDIWVKGEAHMSVGLTWRQNGLMRSRGSPQERGDGSLERCNEAWNEGNPVSGK